MDLVLCIQPGRHDERWGTWMHMHGCGENEMWHSCCADGFRGYEYRRRQQETMSLYHKEVGTWW